MANLSLVIGILAKIGVVEESTTIPNHVDDSKNHLDSLLESGNQVEILESGIAVCTFIFAY